MENKPAGLLVVPLGKALNGIPQFGVADRWPATSKQARPAQGWRTYGTRARCGTPQMFSGAPLDTLILISFNSTVFNLFYTVAPF